MKQLAVIDDKTSDIYPRLSPEQKHIVEAIRCKAIKDTTEQDFLILLDICKSCV